MQKVRFYHFYLTQAAYRYAVFNLSLAVLFHYRWTRIFSLEEGTSNSQKRELYIYYVKSLTGLSGYYIYQNL